MKKYTPFLPLLIVLILALFLRAYKIFDNYYFSGELGKEMIYIREFVLQKSLPLEGMGTSHEWLSYGPFYYWIMIPIFILFKGNPFILFWVSWVVAGLGLVINYFVLKIVTQKTRFEGGIAIVSTVIMAFSPLLIWQTRLSKLHVFFFALMPILMLFCYFLWKGDKKWVIPTGLLFGFLFSFHFSQIPLLGVIGLLFFIKRKIYKFSDYTKFGLSVLLINSTYIWKNLEVLLWVPYRVLNIENKNPQGTMQSLNEYLGKNLFWDNRLWVIGFAVFILIFVHFVIKNKNKIKNEFLTFYIISSIAFMFLGNVLHGAPPVHYFLPVMTTVPLLFAIYLLKIKFWPLVIVTFLAINLFAFAKDPIFYLRFEGNSPNPEIVSYATQNSIASFIVLSSGEKEITIKRSGPYDYFPENYSQNYKYLVIYKGGRVVDNSGNVYNIIETNDGINVQK